MLDLKDISVTFHANTVNERKALDHLSFHVEDGDFISVLGTNGAGKSTLLNVISGTIPCDSGTILLDGKDITAYPEYKRAREIGRLFQDPLKGTAPHMTIEENLGLAYSRGKRTTLSRAIKKGIEAFYRKAEGAGTWSGGSHFHNRGIAEWRAAAGTDTADVHNRHTEASSAG